MGDLRKAIRKGDKLSESIVEEAADLVYHLIVTLMRRGASFDDVQAVLARRAGR